MIKSAIFKNRRTGEVSDKLPDGAVVVNSPNIKNEGIGIDLKDLIMSGGSGLLSYTMADQIFGDDGREKKKRNAFDRLLSKLIPIGIGGLGAYAGHYFAKGMDGKNTQGVKKACVKEAQQEQQQGDDVWEYYVDAKKYGLPNVAIAKPEVKLENGKLEYDSEGRPLLKEDYLHELYDKAMEMSRRTGRKIGDCLEDMRRDAEKWKYIHSGGATGLALASAGSFYKGHTIAKIRNSLRASEEALEKTRDRINNLRAPGRGSGGAYTAVATPLASREAKLADRVEKLTDKLNYRGPWPWRVMGAASGGASIYEIVKGLMSAGAEGEAETGSGFLTSDGRTTVIPAVQ